MLGPFTVPLCLLALSTFFYPKLRMRSRAIALLTLLLLGVGSAFLFSVEPASAQFFGDAETFFEDTFDSSGDGIPIVFGALRALYILYIAVSFVGVINAVRQDEDWQSVARTPVLVIVVVTLADILTGVIIGPGGGGGG